MQRQRQVSPGIIFWPACKNLSEGAEVEACISSIGQSRRYAYAGFSLFMKVNVNYR
jgi:hypothetical protein